jgi:predicted acyl esterase
MPWNPDPLPLADPDPRAEEFLIEMRDSTLLATDVYLPDIVPAPVVLIRTCYDKTSWLTFLPLVAEYINERGYALVAQDVRGKGRSGGASEPFTHEIEDGYDTLEWVVAQPWCKGRVAMFGDSYFAFTAWAAMASGHSALGAVVSRGIATDIQREVIYRDGTFLFATNSFWAPFWLDQFVYDVYPPLDWSHRPMADIIESWLPGRRSVFFDTVRAAPPGAAYWDTDAYAKVNPQCARVPMLHVGGWWEDFHRGQLRDWREAREATDAPQYLLMDATDHFDAQLQPDGTPYSDFRETEEGLRAYLPRYLDPAIAFLDRELLGKDLPAPALVTVEVAEAGWWRGDTWPPREMEMRRLYLADLEGAPGPKAGGTLASEKPSEEEQVEWLHDPQRLVPSLDEVPFRDLVGILPDESEVESRPDVLSFTAAATQEPLDLLGPVRIHLQVHADARKLQVVCKLIDVYPNGRARRIADGARTLASSLTAEPVEFELADIAYRLRPGHRLRLEIAASCFPRYFPVIDPDGDSWTSLTGPKVGYRLATRDLQNSYIEIPVIPGLRLTSS